MTNVETKIATLKLEAKRISDRPESDVKDAVHWSIKINNIPMCEYSEGLGHFLNTNHYLYDKLVFKPFLRAFKANEKIHAPNIWSSSIRPKEFRDLFKNRVNPTTFEIAPPNVKDVLCCLTSDADAINYSFEDWCADFGYDEDSMKAKKIYDSCRDIYPKLTALGFTLPELQEYFQNY